MGLVWHCLQYQVQMEHRFWVSSSNNFFPFRILNICLIYRCYGNVSKKTTITFNYKMLKQMFLPKCFIPCIYPIIAFVIFPSKTEFISDFLYILLTVTLSCEKINQTVHHNSTYSLTCKLVSSIFLQTSQLDLPHFLGPTRLSKRWVSLLQGNYLYS